MGVKSKNRQWLPRPDHNRVSWGFALAVVSGFATIFSIFCMVTHYLSVESRLLMEDPAYRERLMSLNAERQQYNMERGGSALGKESRLGSVQPSLFTTMAPSSNIQGGSQWGTSGSAMYAATQSGMGRQPTLAPGAVGTAAKGTSAATASAKVRETIEAQRAAIGAASASTQGKDSFELGEMSTHPYDTQQVYGSLSRQDDPRAPPSRGGGSASLARQQPKAGVYGSGVAMDSTV